MPANGHARERQVRKLYEEQGWWTIRAAASLGDADVVALKAGEVPLFIEVKANKAGGPYMNFRKADREELKLAAEKAGAQAVLVYWPARQQPRIIPASDWPQ